MRFDKFLLALAAMLSLDFTVSANEPPAAFLADPPAARLTEDVSVDAKPASQTDPWFACHIVVQHGAGITAHGSGTPIAAEGGKTLVLTNAHVVRDNTKPIAVVLSGRSYPAKYVAGSTVRDTGPNTIAVDGPDLCILEVDADLGGVQIADSLPPVGSKVFQCGYGGSNNGKPILRTGYVVESRFTGQLTSSMQVVQGDSGSGVFDESGRLVGVTHGTSGTVSLAETVTTVRSFTFANSDRTFRLFPRLRAQLKGRRTANAPIANLPEPPAAVGAPKKAATGCGCCPGCTCAPGACPTAPRAAAPAQAQEFDLWRVNGQYYRVPKGQTPSFAMPNMGAGGCPNGRCPLPR